MNIHITKKLLIPLLLIFIALFTFSCNTENAGVFMRISESVEKVDVGSVDLIGLIGTKLYAYTGKSGLQSYDQTAKTWSPIESTKVMHYTTDGTYIVHSKQATGDVANDIFTFNPTGSVNTQWGTGYYVVAMNPQHNLMLIRDAAAHFEVYPSNAGGFDRGAASTAFGLGIFSDDFRPTIIASNNTEYVVTGKSNDETKYIHYFDDIPLDPTDASFDDSPLVAVGGDGTNIVVIDSLGEVWKGTTAGTDFVSKGTIPSFPERNPADKPYPTFVHGGNLYIQNSNNEFYSVVLSSGTISADKLSDPFASTLAYIPIKSYLVVGDDVYVGTSENGIYKIDMLTTKDATPL